MFKVDANGALAPNGTVPAGQHPHTINLEPLERFVYVANHDSDFLSGYAIDRNTGALVPVPVTLTVGPGVLASVCDSQARFLYAINGTGPSTIHSYTVHHDGTLSPIGSPLPAGVHAHNPTVDPSDRNVYVTSEVSNEIWTYEIQADGSLIQVSSTAGSGGPNAVVVVSGHTYVANRGGMVQHFDVDTSNGHHDHGSDMHHGELMPHGTQHSIHAGGYPALDGHGPESPVPLCRQS